MIKNKIAQKICSILKVIVFFHFVCLGWLFFRANSLQQAGDMFAGLVCLPILGIALSTKAMIIRLAFFTFALVLVECYQYVKNNLTAVIKMRFPARAFVLIVLFFLCASFGVTGAKEFIYFQF